MNDGTSDKSGAMSVACGLVILAIALFIFTRVLKFHAIVGVGD